MYQVFICLAQVLTPFVFMIFSPDGQSSDDDVAGYAVWFAIMVIYWFWCWGGLWTIIYTALAILNCVDHPAAAAGPHHRPSHRPHNGCAVGWAHVEMAAQIAVFVVFAVWGLVAIPRWFRRSHVTDGALILFITILELTWTVLLLHVQHKMLMEMKARNAAWEVEQCTAQQQLPGNINGGSYQPQPQYTQQPQNGYGGYAQQQQQPLTTAPQQQGDGYGGF